MISEALIHSYNTKTHCYSRAAAELLQHISETSCLVFTFVLFSRDFMSILRLTVQYTPHCLILRYFQDRGD